MFSNVHKIGTWECDEKMDSYKNILEYFIKTHKNTSSNWNYEQTFTWRKMYMYCTRVHMFLTPPLKCSNFAHYSIVLVQQVTMFKHVWRRSLPKQFQTNTRRKHGSGGAAWRHHRRRSCSERMRQNLVNMYEPTVVLSRVYRTFDWPIRVPLVGDMKACLMRNYRYFDYMRVSVLCSVTSEWPSALNKSFTASRSCVSQIYVK